MFLSKKSYFIHPLAPLYFDESIHVCFAALFFRLDSFLERCHDILELCSTIVQFSKLQRIEIGGTKGKTLTTSVRQVCGV